MSKTLPEIIRDHKSIEELMIEIGGEITAEDQERIVDAWMAEIGHDLSKKVDSYEFKKTQLQEAITTLKEHSEKFKQSAKALENLQESLKVRIKDAMLTLNKAEISGNYFTYKLVSSKPSVVIQDESLLPATYIREKLVLEPDKDKIKQDLELGRNIEGAILKQNWSLRTSPKKGK